MTEFPETQSLLIANIQCLENREAWEEFVQIYRPVIYRMARRRGMQDQNAQDLAQEVLLRLAKSLPGWEPREGIRFRHWIRKVASNAIFTAFSNSKSELVLDGSVAREMLDAVSDEATMESELTREYSREVYLRAAAIVRADVSSVTWRAFELTVIEEVSCEEAAEQLGRTVGVVYAARSRILKRLKTEVKRVEGQSNANA